jgi:hypothetical protein
MLDEALKGLTIKIEGVDDSVAHSSDIVMLFRILHGVSHNQSRTNREDVERRIALGEPRIGEAKPPAIEAPPAVRRLSALDWDEFVAGHRTGLIQWNREQLGPFVSRLDRLARSTLDLLSILHKVSEAGAKFRSLEDPWADTTTPHGELMVTILAGLATFERHLIKARTEEGRKRAKERGIRFGRPPKLTAFQRQEAIERLQSGESQADVARAYNVNPAAICRLRRSELGAE